MKESRPIEAPVIGRRLTNLISLVTTRNIFMAPKVLLMGREANTAVNLLYLQVRTRQCSFSG